MTAMAKVRYFQLKVNYSKRDRLGEVIAQKDKCLRCHGHKIVEETKSLDVVILPGCSNGKKIKFSGESDQIVSFN